MKFTTLICWIILLSSCQGFSPFDQITLDELNFGDQSSAIEIFVTGGLTSQLAYHQLIIESPGSILDGQKSVNLKGAVPFIISEFDTIRYILIDTLGPVFYKTIEPVKAEFGKKYTLIIEYNNKTYTATDQMIEVDPFEYDEIVLPSIDTNVAYENRPDLVSFFLTKHEFGYPKGNMWVWGSFVEGINSFEKGSSYLEYKQGTTYSHWASDPNAIFSFIAYYNGIGPFEETDTITTAKYSISDGYYQYLLSLFAETDWKIGEFSTQPSNLPTNFSKGAAGYFFVSDMYEKQIVVGDLLELIEE